MPQATPKNSTALSRVLVKRRQGVAQVKAPFFTNARLLKQPQRGTKKSRSLDLKQV
jgi:hypothetical protein